MRHSGKTKRLDAETNDALSFADVTMKICMKKQGPEPPVSESAAMRFRPPSSRFFLEASKMCAFLAEGCVMLKRTCGIAVKSPNGGGDGGTAVVAARVHGRNVGAGRGGICQAGTRRAPVC